MLIAVPFYKNEGLVRSLADSLVTCRDELAELRAEVVFFNDSPDYAPLGAALEVAVASAARHMRIRVVANPENRGFVRTMNAAMAEAVQRRTDIVLLNSDTVLFPGALREMVRVAALDPMIAFVNPRSNNATLATLPHQPHLRKTHEQAFASAQKLAAFLPDYSYAPTAVGFCMLIRWKILAEFGLFDEIYGRGYNEENDLVMRAGRCGYRAVLANKAFVWHEGEQSFAVSEAPRNELDARNREVLLARYPEYDNLTRGYFQSPEYDAETALGAMLGAENGKLDFAFDFSAFGPFHNGTFRAAQQVLREAAKHWTDRFNLFILCSEETYEFHNYAQYGIERREPHGAERFAFIFRIGQFYDLNAIQRAAQKGAGTGVYMLDTISIDCAQLHDENVVNMWQLVLDHFELVVTTSELTTDQLTRRFSFNPKGVRARVMHSLDLADYAPAPADESNTTGPAAGYTLLVGNHYPHKFVEPTAAALAQAYPDRRFVAFAKSSTSRQTRSPAGRYDPIAISNADNITRLEAGSLSDADIAALFDKANLIVFPSHYEGFGLPVLEALAARKPILARRTPVALEIHESLGLNPNLHLYDTTEELVAKLKSAPAWIDSAATGTHDAVKAAVALHAAIKHALDRVSYASVVRRIRTLQSASLGQMPEFGGHGGAARLIGILTERAAGAVLRNKLVYAGARAVFRLARETRRRLRAFMAS